MRIQPRFASTVAMDPYKVCRNADFSFRELCVELFGVLFGSPGRVFDFDEVRSDLRREYLVYFYCP